MQIGYGKHCLSPWKEDFYLIGYKSPFRNKKAEGIHDDIYCHSILFEIENDYLFMVSLDFLELEDEMVEEIKSILCERFKINRDLILLSATHNHSSIMSYHKNWHSGEFDQEYFDFVIESIVQTFEECLENMQTVTVHYGSETVTGFYSNRNHKEKLADNEISVLHFKNKSGKPVAGLINVAVHSTILGAENNQLTGDLAGQVSQKLKKKWGFFPLVIVGAAADSSNRYERRGRDFEELERVSEGLAEKISAITLSNELELADIRYQTLSHMIFHNMKDVQRSAQKFLDSHSPIKNKGLIEKCNRLLEQERFKLLLQFSVIQLGDLQIITFPGELASKFGIELKKVSRHYGKTTIIAGYTNGFHHYFMPKEEYGLSFETIGNPVPAGETEKIVEKMRISSYLLSLGGEKGKGIYNEKS